MMGPAPAAKAANEKGGGGRTRDVDKGKRKGKKSRLIKHKALEDQAEQRQKWVNYSRRYRANKRTRETALKEEVVQLQDETKRVRRIRGRAYRLRDGCGG